MFAAIAVFGVIISLALPVLRDSRFDTRLKEVMDQREKLRRAHRASLEQPSIKRDNKGLITSVTKTLDLQKLLQDPNIASKLEQAGMRGPKPLMIFYFCRFILPIVSVIIVFIYIFLVNDHGATTQMKYGSLILGAAIGFYAPNVYVANRATKRQQSIMRAFPDALDMMLICVESGNVGGDGF